MSSRSLPIVLSARACADYESITLYGIAQEREINVMLPPRYEALIREKVMSGRYLDESAVLQEALELLDERDRLAWLRAEVAEADAEVARGELVDWSPDFMDRLKRDADEDERKGVPIPADVTS